MKTEQATGRALGVSTPDLLGDAPGVEPATPGSYGRAPTGFRLPEATRLGPVRLQVADLGRSLDYYQRVLGLRLLQETRSGATLGTPSGTELVELVERRGVRPAPGRARTGLFHFAILLPERAALGRFARHLGELQVGAGAADHLVSEALYLQDPDNLGIEVYADRPRTAWRRVGRELVMATDPIDGDGLLEAAGTERWEGVPAETVMGHVHLHVGDLGRAAAFSPRASASIRPSGGTLALSSSAQGATIITWAPMSGPTPGKSGRPRALRPTRPSSSSGRSTCRPRRTSRRPSPAWRTTTSTSNRKRPPTSDRRPNCAIRGGRPSGFGSRRPPARRRVARPSERERRLTRGAGGDP